MTVLRGIALTFLGLTVLILFAPVLFSEGRNIPGPEVAMLIAAANALGLFWAGRSVRNLAQRIGLWLVVAGTAAALLAASLDYWFDAIWPSGPGSSDLLGQMDAFMRVADALALAMLVGIGGGWLLWLIGRIAARSTRD